MCPLTTKSQYNACSGLVGMGLKSPSFKTPIKPKLKQIERIKVKAGSQLQPNLAGKTCSCSGLLQCNALGKPVTHDGALSRLWKPCIIKVGGIPSPSVLDIVEVVQKQHMLVEPGLG